MFSRGRFVCFSRSGHVGHRRGLLCVSDPTSRRASVPGRTRAATGEVGQGHQNATFLSRRVAASAVQHRLAPVSRHVHLCDIRHVVLHERETSARHRRHVQL